jgi:hypothetical protein
MFWMARKRLGGTMFQRKLELTLALALLLGMAIMAGLSPRTVALADPSTQISCQGGSVGLNDCTIVLQSAVPAGGSFTVSSSNSGAIYVQCSTIPFGGTCNVQPNSITFACPQGCAAGSAYRDVVQLGSGSGANQTLAMSTSIPPNAASPCIGPGGVELCGSASGAAACGGTDIFVGIGSVCSGIQSVDCQVTLETGVTGTCNGASTNCLAQSLANVTFNPCGLLPYATGVTPFPTNQPITLSSSQAANPSCTSALTTNQLTTTTDDAGDVIAVAVPVVAPIQVC